MPLEWQLCSVLQEPEMAVGKESLLENVCFQGGLSDFRESSINYV